MISCSSCKNKTSNERCSNKPLKGLIVCGKHAKVKNPRIWLYVNDLDSKAILIQKNWRRHAIRSWIKLAGQGVLNRSCCHNDEEIVTFEDKKSVHPLDYFSFEENGKIYWFDTRSLSENSMTVQQPINPYTRQPLTIETRRRLRQICYKRHRKNLPNIHSTTSTRDVDEIVNTTWLSVCQMVEENGFFGMSPLYFVSLNRTQLFVFVTIIAQDLTAWAAEHTSVQSRRRRYVFWMKRLIDEFTPENNITRLSYLSSRVLTTILNDCMDNYAVCFMIMASLHRL